MVLAALVFVTAGLPWTAGAAEGSHAPYQLATTPVPLETRQKIMAATMAAQMQIFVRGRADLVPLVRMAGLTVNEPKALRALAEADQRQMFRVGKQLRDKVWYPASRCFFVRGSSLNSKMPDLGVEVAMPEVRMVAGEIKHETWKRHQSQNGQVIHEADIQFTGHSPELETFNIDGLLFVDRKRIRSSAEGMFHVVAVQKEPINKPLSRAAELLLGESDIEDPYRTYVENFAVERQRLSGLQGVFDTQYAIGDGWTDPDYEAPDKIARAITRQGSEARHHLITMMRSDVANLTGAVLRHTSSGLYGLRQELEQYRSEGKYSTAHAAFLDWVGTEMVTAEAYFEGIDLRSLDKVDAKQMAAFTVKHLPAALSRGHMGFSALYTLGQLSGERWSPKEDPALNGTLFVDAVAAPSHQESTDKAFELVDAAYRKTFLSEEER